MNQSPSAAGVGQVESGCGVALPSGAVQLTDQIECVQRELRMRSKTYKRWVPAGKITQTAADLELVRMEAVLQSLVALKSGLVASAPNVKSVRVAERERVLNACAIHMSTEVFLRVAKQVRTS